MRELLLATNNPGKARELRALIRGEYWVFTTPAERGVDLNVEETGNTFEENAVLKARAFAGASGLITLADDSGLEVDALEGEPGVFSARYAGPNATDKELYEYLLSRLADYPWEKRRARFRCVISIAFPEGEMVLCKGECPGMIALEPKGNNGFGYDPVFWLPEHGRTMAELAPADKNKISHRGKAAEQARLYLDFRLAEAAK